MSWWTEMDWRLQTALCAIGILFLEGWLVDHLWQEYRQNQAALDRRQCQRLRSAQQPTGSCDH